MAASGAATRVRKRTDLFDRIGAFLAAHGLGPEPENYSFVYTVLTDPSGPLALAVARITDGGFRLSTDDLATLGVDLRFGAPITPTATAPKSAPPADPQADQAEQLVAQTQAQVDGFADMVRTIRNEASDFGRDLAASAAEISRSADRGGIEEIARITGSMVARVRHAETQLESATREADALREKLAEAQESARRDPLTGLANRRALTEALAKRVPNSRDCVALCDIDRFKLINDVHGHPVGDRVLTAIARILAEECAGHMVVRHGGEEFSIYMQGVDLAEASALLEQVRAAVAARRFRDRDTGASLGSITISAGVTAFRPGEITDRSLERADQLLYTAKSQGRDQVCTG